MEGSDESAPSSNLLLHGIGDVVLALDHEALSWKPLESVAMDSCSCCLGHKISSKTETEIKISDIYAVENFSGGLISERMSRMGRLRNRSHPRPDMHHFVVHSFGRSKGQQCVWVPSAYIFSHGELDTCQKWIQNIKKYIVKDAERPKNLLVFVHPFSGRGKGCKIWELVNPIFCRANVNTRVIVTQRAGHAFDLITSISDEELASFDGIVAVGGDGFFNEILNGLLLTRHKTIPMHSSEDFLSIGKNGLGGECSTNTTGGKGSIDDAHGDVTTDDSEDAPLLQNSTAAMQSSFKTSKQALPCVAGYSVLSFPNDHFRLGLIPAGSTDSIVISTTGARDAKTSALQIVLGKKICLDIAQVIRWKTCSTSNHAPTMRYAASFAGYGFYGDVVKESEKYRWMGPRRYDFAGTKVFLKHSSYDADVSFLEVTKSNTFLVNGSENAANLEKVSLGNPHKRVCLVSCNVCKDLCRQARASHSAGSVSSSLVFDNSRWLQRKGRFHCVGAAIISCRNERAPDGLVADAHLADGFMHLILIKECPRSFYLWHLTKLTRRGSNPLDFNFIEHHRTPAFTFETSKSESIWNLDGELFQACHLSVRAFHGLINLFATGPEV